MPDFAHSLDEITGATMPNALQTDSTMEVAWLVAFDPTMKMSNEWVFVEGDRSAVSSL